MDAQGTDQQKLLAFAQENRRLRHNLEQSKKDAAKAAEAALQEAERHAAERAADRAALEETFKAALREAEERHAAERAADRAALEASSRELNLLRVALMKEELARAKAEVEAAHMKGFERFKEEMLEAFSQPPEKAGLAAERGTPKPQVNCVCCGLPATGNVDGYWFKPEHWGGRTPVQVDPIPLCDLALHADAVFEAVFTPETREKIVGSPQNADELKQAFRPLP